MSFLLPVSTSAPVKKSGWTLLGFILIGGLLGGMLGEILTVFSPSEQIQTIFARALSPGINPPLTVDLVLIKVTSRLSLQNKPAHDPGYFSRYLSLQKHLAAR